MKIRIEVIMLSINNFVVFCPILSFCHLQARDDKATMKRNINFHAFSG